MNGFDLTSAIEISWPRLAGSDRPNHSAHRRHLAQYPLSPATTGERGIEQRIVLTMFSSQPLPARHPPRACGLLHRLHRFIGRLEVAPEALLIDIGLGDRRTRDLDIGSPALGRHHRVETKHVIVAGLDLLLVDDLVGEHRKRCGLSVERLLDLDILTALADEIETDGRPI